MEEEVLSICIASLLSLIISSCNPLQFEKSVERLRDLISFPMVNIFKDLQFLNGE